MTAFGFSQTPNSLLADSLTLSKWYKIENDNLVEQPAYVAPQNGQYVSLFGGDISFSALQALVSFIGSSHISAVTVYQPHASLKPALAVHLQPSESLQLDSTFKMALRNFAAERTLQAALVSQPASINQPGLLIMDMDSTAIEIECIDEIARLANVYDEVASVTAQAMAGQLAFSESLYKRVAKLEGIELPLIQALKDNLPLMEGIDTLCATLKQHNWHLVLASGGFTWFAEALKSPLGLDEFHANELEIVDNRLTGKVLGEVVDAQKKADILVSARNQMGIPQEQSVAIGDGANDLVMMAEAGTGVAIHGKPKVVENADAAICKGSLLQLLYFVAIPVKSQ